MGCAVEPERFISILLEHVEELIYDNRLRVRIEFEGNFGFHRTGMDVSVKGAGSMIKVSNLTKLRKFCRRPGPQLCGQPGQHLRFCRPQRRRQDHDPAWIVGYPAGSHCR